MPPSLQDEYIKKEILFGAQNYAPLSVVLKKGKGAYLWDVDGNKYLDMVRLILRSVMDILTLN